MFFLFIEYREVYLHDNTTCGISLQDITIILSLFADDMAILDEIPPPKKKGFNILQSYCDMWGKARLKRKD